MKNQNPIRLKFGVVHIFASFNDTFIHVTDLSGSETLIPVSLQAGAGATV